ncbi:pheromone-processing carboxypeptidase KEX1 [Neltuma alba]|uniref:pheromone-processing carboxypeptidase KEX1 n=1 Tax=Neltuma alba TaxID=207710 RepID=UPI0010A4C3C3|nr:pheromone-processing carboxypeptidase KEX1 [Prosopis alba]
MSSRRRGQPKHQNKYAWKPNASRKINETEVGGRFRPLSEITGVCPRCKEQIDWKRRYGKYKPLVEPAKCQRCSKRAVRQAYHNLCSGCAKEHGVCAKCCCAVDRIVGRDLSDVEAEQKQLEEAIKNSRERDRRTLLRAMNRGKSKCSAKTPTDTKDNKVGDLFPNASLEDYAKQNRPNGDHDGGEIYDDKYVDSDDEDDDSENEDCDEEDNGENEECDDEDNNDDNSDNEDCEDDNEDDDNHEKLRSK